MESAEAFLTMLRQEYKIFLQPNHAEYLMEIFDACLTLKQNVIEDNVIEPIFTEAEVKIISEKLREVVDKAKKATKKQKANKMVNDDVNLKRTLAYQNDEVSISQRKKKNIKMDQLEPEYTQKTKNQSNNHGGLHKRHNKKQKDIRVSSIPASPTSIEQHLTAPSSPVKKEVSVSKCEAQKQNLKKRLEAKNVEKCRYFQFCLKGDSCPYFHPTEKCKYMPHCRFGDDCLYIHDVCKYRNSCMRVGCNYAHQRKAQLKQIIQAMAKTVQECTPDTYIEEENQSQIVNSA